MKDDFEQIRDQIHEIRIFLGPLDLKLEGLDVAIAKSRATFELKTAQLESKITEHSSQLALQSEQIRQIQIFLKMPQNLDGRMIAGSLEDKQKPTSTPQQEPPQ